MNVIDYITITCNLKNVRLQITFDYMKNVIDYNRLRLQITISPCLDWSISKKSSPLKLPNQMNRNLVASIYMYGRFCIKFPQSRMKGERHRLNEPLVKSNPVDI